MCLLHAHNDCTHRFAKRDSGDDGAEVWDHNAWTGQDEWLLVALQTELAKRIAKDSEAIVFEARGEEVSWRGGRWARGGMSMPRFAPCVGRCCENLSTGPAVANGSRLHAKGTRTCLEFGHHSIQMQPTPPEFYANATCFFAEFVRITFKCKPNLS